MKTLFGFAFCLITFQSFAAFPPDSTNSTLDKGTAQYYISEGRRLYSEGQYQVALVKFREALAKDINNPVATYWLGECHLALGNYEKARDYAEQAIAMDTAVYAESGNLLGICYHRLGNLDKAIANYSKLLSTTSESRQKELRVQFHIDECNRAKEMMAAPIKVTITPLSMNINSPFDDYAPVLSPDGKAFYFVSRRADNFGGGVSPGDKRYFEDIYVSLWDETKQEWGEATNSDELVKRLNSYGFDAINQISPDGKTLYLTVNTMSLDAPKPKTKHSDIFVSKINNKGGWNTPRPLDKPIRTTYFEAAASFTDDGKTIYFVSERLGGEGGADIWTSTKTGSEWSKPVNLGPIINTIGQETTVNISGDGKLLFFSSTGHKGMGGYDVYVSRNTGGAWSEPMNLGYPINTVSDETHFVYYPALNKAFYSTFSSAENKGIGARDLFEVDMSGVKLP
jgi:tetratricopeptide (TPR) repeat protein